MARHRTFTDQEFIEAVRSSTAIRQVLTKLKLRETGGNYDSCKKHLKRLAVNTDHFRPSWNKGVKIGPQRPLSDYLCYGSPIQSTKLKQRLIEAGIFKYECSSCLLTTWLERPMPLELDHIDGDHKNNALQNLRLLCPNCHVFTPTYKAKNIGRVRGTRTHT